MSRPQRIIMAGGGTGGHLYPGIALAEAFVEQQANGEVLFVGTSQGLEKTLLPKLGYDVEFVRASRVKGAGLWARLRSIARLPLGVWDAWKILSKFRPQLVVSVGGYAAAPTVIASWLRRIPIVTVEPNAIPGLTNRVLGKLAKRVLLAHEQALSWFRRSKSRVVGVPLRKDLVARLTAASEDVKRASNAKPHVFIFGGSQGARFLNQQVPAVLQGLDVTVLHQTGVHDYDAVCARYEALGMDVDVRVYVDDMAEAYATADLAITRSGASTVAELALTGTPAILVPLPYAADDHQSANARMLSDVDGGLLVQQSGWKTADLHHWLSETLMNRERLNEMAANARSVAHPAAATDAMAVCLKLIARDRRSLSGPVGVL